MIELLYRRGQMWVLYALALGATLVFAEWVRQRDIAYELEQSTIEVAP